MAEYFSDDWVSLINRVATENTKNLIRFTGEVKEVSTDTVGALLLYCAELQSDPSDKNTWIWALPGSMDGKSFIIPKIGDIVEFHFYNNLADRARWNCITPSKLSDPGSTDTTDYIYIDSNVKIYNDKTTNPKVIIENTTSKKITIETTGITIEDSLMKITTSTSGLKLENGASSIEVTPTGIIITGTTVTINGLNVNTHIHATTGLPPAPTAPPS